MNTSQHYWDDNNSNQMQPVKYESCNSNDEAPRLKDEPNTLYRFCDGNLNFATVACSEDDSEYGTYQKKSKVSRQDPMSHRIIEKRRRDRMNNCLADLSRLIPADYLKKGRGRIEKTEIIEMAIKHMKYLQQCHHGDARQPMNTEHYRLGFQECMSETMRFLVEVEGFFPREALCVKLINHLQAHCEALLASDRLHSGNPTGPPISTGITNNGNPTSILPPPTLHSPSHIRTPLTPPNGNRDMHLSQQQPQQRYDPNSQLRDMLSSNMMKESMHNGQNLMQPIIHHQHLSHSSGNSSNSVPLGPMGHQLQNEPMPLTPATSVESRIVSPSNIDKLNAFSMVRNMERNSDIYEYQRLTPEESQNGSEINSGVPNGENFQDDHKNRYETSSTSSHRHHSHHHNDGSVISENDAPSRECSNGAALYKFKNNIMQRINKETVSSSTLSTHNINKLFKRRKLGGSNGEIGSGRRASSTTENYSFSENSPTDGSQTSPPGSDVYTRISSESDNQNRISPTGSSVSDNKQNGRQSPKPFSSLSSNTHTSATNSSTSSNSAYPKHLTQISRNSHEIMKNNSSSSASSQYSSHNYRHSSTATRNNIQNAITQMCQNKNAEKHGNFNVPIFVLHAKGSFYIPLTIDYNTLVPYLQNYNILDLMPSVHNIVLHPVTINVNFQSNNANNASTNNNETNNNTKPIKYKTEVIQNGWH